MGQVLFKNRSSVHINYTSIILNTQTNSVIITKNKWTEHDSSLVTQHFVYNHFSTKQQKDAKEI